MVAYYLIVNKNWWYYYNKISKFLHLIIQKFEFLQSQMTPKFNISAKLQVWWK
jgi:hypothetical protein